MAIRAGGLQRIADAMAHFLPCHFHKAQLRDSQHVGFGTILFQFRFERIQHPLLIRDIFHIDEIHYDNAADIAKP
jgi:hypothetical protein